MEADEINRRVAEALGYTVEEKGNGWRLLCNGMPTSCLIFTHRHGAWGAVLKFATDPAAADLVRQEIERRGWWWRMDYSRPMRVGDFVYTACCYSPSLSFRPATGASPHEALCLAYLAACEASKEVE